jgi:hypothetical protein
MLKQLLWAEVLLKGGVGLALLLAPVYSIALAGFPSAGNGFWPRLTGAILLGIAAALLLQGMFPAVRTISPAGLIAINLAGAAGLTATQVLGKGAQTRRGKALFWLMAIGLAMLSLVEIAYA